MRTSAELLLLGFLSTLLACGPTAKKLEEDREAIRQTLEEYLPELSRAYIDGDLEPLRQWAGEKEVATTFRRLHELRDGGRRLEPRFRDVRVDEVLIPRYANAVITTVETWDLRVYAADTDTVLSESEGQRSRVQYHLLRRPDGSWQVLSRSVQEVLD